jgi:CDP-diacylglycerol--glycerol-3-phosphate 3-phosphatidyltransferase
MTGLLTEDHGTPGGGGDLASKPSAFNLPNLLTASRFFLALILFVLIPLGVAGSSWAWLASLILFALAAFTDWLDGYLARIQGLSSSLGRMLDPLVDKVLMCGLYISFLPWGAREGWLQPWMVIVVVAREMVITGLRGYLESLGAEFGADWLGKLKMVLQCAAVFAIFVYALGSDTGLPLAFSIVVRDILIWGMVAATLLSGLQYLGKAVLLVRKKMTR